MLVMFGGNMEKKSSYFNTNEFEELTIDDLDCIKEEKNVWTVNRKIESKVVKIPPFVGEHFKFNENLQDVECIIFENELDTNYWEKITSDKDTSFAEMEDKCKFEELKCIIFNNMYQSDLDLYILKSFFPNLALVVSCAYLSYGVKVGSYYGYELDLHMEYLNNECIPKARGLYGGENGRPVTFRKIVPKNKLEYQSPIVLLHPTGKIIVDDDEFGYSLPHVMGNVVIGEYFDDMEIIYNDDVFYGKRNDELTIIAFLKQNQKEIIIDETYDGLPITEIGDGAFSALNCEKITLPKTIKKINENSFVFCDNLEEIDAESTEVKTIDNEMIGTSGEKIIKVKLPTKARTCISNAMERHKLKQYPWYPPYLDFGLLNRAFKANVEEVKANKNKFLSRKAISVGETDVIKSGIFKGFSKLMEVIIPSTVKKIESKAFADCKMLINVFINSKDVEIDKNAFYGCNRLRMVYLPIELKGRYDNNFFTSSINVKIIYLMS